MAVDNDDLIRAIMRDRDKIFAYCWAILRDDNLVEDVFQEVCALAVQKRDSILDQNHLAGWLCVTARRKSFEAARARNAQPLLFDQEILDLLEANWRKWDRHAHGPMLDALRRCIALLNDRSRQLLTMRYELGMKSPQMAEQLGCRIETVYMATMRVHARLKDCILEKLSAPGRTD